MRRSSLWTKTVALGLLIGASVIGNVSLSAANARLATDQGNSTQSRMLASNRLLAEPLVRADSYGGLGSAASGGTPTASSESDDAVGPTNESASADDNGQVVPAIYAWDPDVKFVFYRHISKWM